MSKSKKKTTKSAPKTTAKKLSIAELESVEGGWTNLDRITGSVIRSNTINNTSNRTTVTSRRDLF